MLASQFTGNRPAREGGSGPMKKRVPCVAPARIPPGLEIPTCWMDTSPDPLDDIDRRHAQLVEQLDELNGRIEAVLEVYTSKADGNRG